MSLVFKFKYDVIIGSLQRPCNFDVSQCIKSKFSDMVYFDLFYSKMLLVSNSRLVLRHNDVIMRNMEDFVTLVFFKIESKNLVSWGILMQIFQQVIYFQIQSFYDVSMTS